MQSATVAHPEGRAPSPDPAAEGRPGGSDRPELSFVHPIPGFTDLRRFVLVRLDAVADEDGPGDGAAPMPNGSDSSKSSTGSNSPAGSDPAVVPESPLYELRSLEQADVRFMVALPEAFFSGYEIELGDQECEDLGLTDAADALVLVMLTVGRDAAGTSANLLAPIVINARTRVAAQVILTGSDWPVRAPLG
jgi:flagellar assembly factor FliW